MDIDTTTTQATEAQSAVPDSLPAASEAVGKGSAAQVAEVSVPNGGADATAGGEAPTEAGTEGTPSEHASEQPRPTRSGANAANAERRRQYAERQREDELSRVREEVRRQTILDTLGSVNPYTHEPMKDDADIKEFLEMKEIEKRGGDPVGEYAKYHKQIERERSSADAAEATRRERQRRAEDERTAFMQAHPDVDLSSLVRDKDFMAFAAGRASGMSLTEIYDGYTEQRRAQEERVEARAKEMAAQMIANAKASPGSAVGEAGATPDVYTPEGMRKMSRAEVKANYEKIAASYWK